MPANDDTVQTPDPIPTTFQRSLPPPENPPLTEAECYYANLPPWGSSPVLIARTSTTPWVPPTGPEAYFPDRELRPVGPHRLQDVWEDGGLAAKIHSLLGDLDVKWTSTDVVRIAHAGKPSASAPIILWIGVLPNSLSREDGAVAAHRCRQLLLEADVHDVDVEIRESVVTRTAGPKLFTPDFSPGTARALEPLSTTLGLPICAQVFPGTEGTGGFFFINGNDTTRLFLVTARHVLFPPEYDPENQPFIDNSESRKNVALLGEVGFQDYLNLLSDEIENHSITLSSPKVLEMLQSRIDLEPPQSAKSVQLRRALQNHEFGLRNATSTKESLEALREEVTKHWSALENRIIGHVAFSPPVSCSEKGFTEDWAVVEVDTSKIDLAEFCGNAIDLGTKPSPGALISLFKPNTFQYPYDRLLRMNDTIPDDEMRHLTDLDVDGAQCLVVLKRGRSTGLTIGRANNIMSYTRRYPKDRDPETSKQWAIFPFESKTGCKDRFSDKGDSGAVVVDRRGRMGGILTSGARRTETSGAFIAYATPISFVLEYIRRKTRMQPNLTPTFT